MEFLLVQGNINPRLSWNILDVLNTGRLLLFCMQFLKFVVLEGHSSYNVINFASVQADSNPVHGITLCVRLY